MTAASTTSTRRRRRPSFDCDGDGRPDLYVAGGANPAAPLPQREPGRRGAPVRAGRRLRRRDLDRRCIGAYPLDIDGDGIVDLAVLRAGGIVLLRGPRRLPLRAMPTRLVVRWRRRPGRPHSARPGRARRVAADARRSATTSTRPRHPATYRCADNVARPAGAARARATRRRSPSSPGCCALSMLFSDWDGSGRRDLRMTTTVTTTIGRRRAALADRARASRRVSTPTRDGWRPLKVWGMGIASYDLTGDGQPEVYLTSQGDNKLQTLAAGPAQPAYRRHRPEA